MQSLYYRYPALYQAFVWYSADGGATGPQIAQGAQACYQLACATHRPATLAAADLQAANPVAIARVWYRCGQPLTRVLNRGCAAIY